MSLLLVLAMVLAMVPAVLAGSTYSVGVGATIDVFSTYTTSYGAALTWKSNDTTVATVSADNSGHTTVTGVKAGYTTITATGTKNNYTQTVDTFTVYVQDAYTLTLTQSDPNNAYNTSTNLFEGDTRTLTATVSVSGVQEWNQSKVRVKFECDTAKATIANPTATLTEVKNSSGYVTSYVATTTLTAVDSGYAKVTAKVQYQKSDENWYDSASTYAQEKYILFKISGKTAIKVNLPTDQTNFDLIVGGTNPTTATGTLTPTVTGVTGADAKLKYVYDSTHIYVDTTTGTGATIRPVSACAATKIYICLQKNNPDLTYAQIDQTNPSATPAAGDTTHKAIVGDYKVCTVSVRKAGMAITKLEVMTDSQTQRDLNKGTKVVGVLDPNYKEAGKQLDSSLILKNLTLYARIKEPATLLASETDREEAYTRIKWSSSDENVAKVESNGISKTTGYVGYATASIKAVAPGTATITAKADNVTATYVVTVYQGRAYAFDAEKNGPSLGDTVGKMTDTELARLFEKETAKVEVQTGYYADEKTTYNLPLKDVTAVSDRKSNKVTFTYKINGVKTATKEFFYDRDYPNAEHSYSTTAAFSDITFTEQPITASYKLTDTIANLSAAASVSSPATIKSMVWYMNSDQTTGGGDRAIFTESISGTHSSLRSVLSNVKQYITGTGTYVFFCRVTAESGSGSSKTTSSADTRKAIINVTGENHINIVFNPTTAKAGDTFTITGTPQDYVNGTLTNVTGKTYTVTWSSSDESIVKLSSKTSTNSSPSITATAKAGGTVTIKAEATVGAKKYAAEKTFTVTVPTADTVRLTLGENDSYVLLDGSKLAAAVKDACKTTPSTFTFKAPANGTLYTTSSLSNTVGTSTKYSASEVSKMAYRPTRTTGTHEIEYAAYDGSAQIAAGKILVLTSANTVEYHIAANEKQQMVVSDFQSVYGSGLSSVTFGSNTDIRGGLYKGSTTSSGKVGSESYSVSSGTNLLKNVYFIAGTTVSKYSVTIPFTATGSSGTVNGQLVVYVNDTHTLNVTGATFRSLGIATELAPDNATGSTYITIDRVVGGKLYSSYTSIKSCTALTSKDLGSTKFYFTGSNSLDNLYVLPLADSKSVDITYTIDGSTKGTLTFKVNQQTSSNQFTDVTGNFKWAANSVDFMFMNGIINGNSTKNPKIFGPSAKMTRAMLVTVLYRAAGEPTVAGITNKFTDNKQGKYYYNAVLWASNLGIVNGATATTFDPDGNITREQIAAILYRYAGSPTVTGSLSGYADQAQVSSFAVTAMQWAVGSGIIAGTPNGGKTYLTAKGNATRAQVAVMLHRFLTFD